MKDLASTGYQPIGEWIVDEIRRRKRAELVEARDSIGEVDDENESKSRFWQTLEKIKMGKYSDQPSALDDTPLPSIAPSDLAAEREAVDQYGRVLRELIAYLGKEQVEGKKLALCEHPILELEIPTQLWRQGDILRAGVSRGTIRFIHQLYGEVRGRVVVRGELRISPEVLDKDVSSLPIKNTGGAPKKWNWEQGINDVWKHLYENGATKIITQADVTRLLMDKMTQRPDGGPSLSEAKKRARMIFHSLRDNPE